MENVKTSKSGKGIGKNIGKDTGNKSVLIMVRVGLILVILAIGYMGMTALASLKQPPAEAHVQERAVQVEAQIMETEDVPVIITGYGEVKTLNVVSISSEVGGRVVEVHPNLENGETISKNEMLFRIDKTDYLALYVDANANVARFESVIKRMEKQYQIETRRLKTIKRNLDLSEAEYNRVKKLYNKSGIGTRSSVDKTEQAYNSALDRFEQMDMAVSLFPMQISEAKSNLVSAQARLSLASANLERCEVKAPFTGRVKSVSIEQGQYVVPGFVAVTLANDSILEIEIPIDSVDANKWLLFNGKNNKNRTAWFNGLEKVPCKVKWTESENGHSWTGQLNRVVKFDQKTRTVTVAIRIDAEKAWLKDDSSLPLVEGMFCKVEIPGRSMEDVFRLPRWAVTFNNTVYIVENNRLKTVPVTVKRSQGEFTFISEGLNPGDTIITTRLIEPLENTLLEITSN